MLHCWPQDHSYSSQGADFFNFGCNARLTSCSDGWPFRPIHLPSIQAHSEKVNPEPSVGHSPREGTFASMVRPALPVTLEIPETQMQSSLDQAVPVATAAAASNLLQRAVFMPTPVKAKGKLPLSSPTASMGRGPSGSDVGDCDSVSLVDGSQDLDADQDGAPKTSKLLLHWLKSKLPLKNFMSGERLGRQERNVKPYLTNGRLNASDIKLLRNHLKMVIGWAQNSCHSCCR